MALYKRNGRTISQSSANTNWRRQVKIAQRTWGPLPTTVVEHLTELLVEHGLSISFGELTYLQGHWYVTHAGLLRIARDKHCYGIEATPIKAFSDPSQCRWAFRAKVYKSRSCRGFTGYGDADPTSVRPLVHGAEMRVAETRAVNRALRKAYGIGICSVEEIGSIEKQQVPDRQVRKLPPKSTNGTNGHPGNGNGARLRDRLCQLIRLHNLDAELVKAYAVEFCGTKTLREASREQVEAFVSHLADWAAKDRNAVLCRLNSYARAKEGAA